MTRVINLNRIAFTLLTFACLDSAIAQPADSTAVVVDVLNFVDEPCAAPDQNPVCWGKTYMACNGLNKKYCKWIGIPESAGYTPWSERDPATRGEYPGVDAERKASDLMSVDAWTLSFKQLSQLVEDDYDEQEFVNFVAVGPERFKSEQSIPMPMMGDYELRLAEYVTPESHSNLHSVFFRLESGRWRLVSWAYHFRNGYTGEFDAETPCDPTSWFCALRPRGITPWPLLGQPKVE